MNPQVIPISSTQSWFSEQLGTWELGSLWKQQHQKHYSSCASDLPELLTEVQGSGHMTCPSDNFKLHPWGWSDEILQESLWIQAVDAPCAESRKEK